MESGFFSTSLIKQTNENHILAISEKRMNFYSRTTETDSGSTMKVFAAFGYDIFISPDKFPTDEKNNKKVIDLTTKIDILGVTPGSDETEKNKNSEKSNDVADQKRVLGNEQT